MLADFERRLFGDKAVIGPVAGYFCQMIQWKILWKALKQILGRIFRKIRVTSKFSRGDLPYIKNDTAFEDTILCTF